MMPTNAGPKKETIGSMAGRSAWRKMMRLMGRPLARAVRIKGLFNTSIIVPRVIRAILDT